LSDPVLLVQALGYVVHVELAEGLHLAHFDGVSERPRAITNQMDIVVTTLVEQDFFRLFKIVGALEEPAD
jgi:hypothetical protein